MFISEEFKTAWAEWKDHFQKKTLSMYSDVSERKALSALFKKSHGIEQLAIDSIDWSIEKNWSAVYIKPTENGQGNNTNGTSSNSLREGVNSEFMRRYSGKG